MKIAVWRKPSRSSSGAQGNCVETARLPAGAGIGIRDSKAPFAGHLTVEREAFAALVQRVRSGALDIR